MFLCTQCLVVCSFWRILQKITLYPSDGSWRDLRWNRFLSFYNTFHSSATRLCYRIEPSIKDTLSQKRFLMEIQRKMTLENWPLKVSKDLWKWPKHLCKVYNCCKKFYLHDAGNTFLSFSWLAIDFILGDNDWARSWLPQTKAKCAAQGWSNDICSV